MVASVNRKSCAAHDVLASSFNAGDMKSEEEGALSSKTMGRSLSLWDVAPDPAFPVP